MAPNSDTNNETDVVSTNPQMAESTITGTLISPSSSNFPNNSLSFDLILEILARLPLKPVLRFQSLCKSINALISEPIFTNKHFRVSPTRHHLILTPPLLYHRFRLISYPIHSIFHSATETPIEFDYPFNKHYISIAGSCNGILCLPINQTTVILWNPFIGKFKKLPSFQNPQWRGFTFYGFGYVPAIDLYKVLAIFCYRLSNNHSELKHHVKIHTLGTDSWRIIHQEIPLPIDFDGSLKFVSDALHWFSKDEKKKTCIVSFNLVNELCTKFSQPDYGVGKIGTVLCVLKDCLSIFAYYKSYYAIWVMKEYGNEESWTRLFRVSYSESTFSFRVPKPVWIFEDDEVLTNCRHLKMNLVSYGIKYSPFYKILMFESFTSLISPRVCIGSLISPCF